MKLNNLTKLLVIGCAAISVIGCSSSGKKGMKTLGDRASFYGEDISAADEKNLQAVKTIYFGFDRYDISDENRRILLAHARKLLENPSVKMRIEGHTDRQGSRPYNIALGQNRADAAKQILEMKGVGADQVVTVSYGKERAVDLGDTEDAFAKNRRDELVYESK